MEFKDLAVNGCISFEPKVFDDNRGEFFEWFQDSTIEIATGEKFNLAQANCSKSRKGVVRGVHFTKNAPGQSKLVTVLSGKVFDVMVDLRKNSPTFGKWDSVILDGDVPKVVYIPWGVGHGFMSLEENTVFTYLCDSRYNPSNEFDLNALDDEVGIIWPEGYEFIRSPKDAQAPFLKEIYANLPN